MLISILQVKTWRSREVKKQTQGYTASWGKAKFGSQVGLASKLCQQADLLQIRSRREAGGNLGRGDRGGHCSLHLPIAEIPPTLGLSWPVSPQERQVWVPHFCIELLAWGSGLNSARSPCEPMNERHPSVSCREMAFAPLGSRPPTCPPAVANPCGSSEASSSGPTIPFSTLATTGWASPRPPRLSACTPGFILPLHPPPCRCFFSGFSLLSLAPGLSVVINSSSPCWPACCFSRQLWPIRLLLVTGNGREGWESGADVPLLDRVLPQGLGGLWGRGGVSLRHKVGPGEGPCTPQSLETLHSFSLLVVVTLRQALLCDGPRSPTATTRNALPT